MENFVLSCCSTADMTKSHFDKRNIKYLCFHYFLDDVEHVDDFGETIPLNQFYQMMVDGILTRTSQINVETLCPGSVAYVIETGAVYILNSQKE